MENGTPFPQPQPEKERFIIIPLSVPGPGQIHIENVSFRGMPQKTDEPWTAWKYTHNLLLKAAEIAHNKMLEEMQKDRPLVDVARVLPKGLN